MCFPQTLLPSGLQCSEAYRVRLPASRILLGEARAVLWGLRCLSQSLPSAAYTICLIVDNQALAICLDKGRVASPSAAWVLRGIFLLLRRLGWCLRVAWCDTESMAADPASRGLRRDFAELPHCTEPVFGRRLMGSVCPLADGSVASSLLLP